jgi:hypothetical protein
MSKNTAVEWLVTELRNRIAEGTLDAIVMSKLKMEAKAMEREQIEEAFRHGELFSADYYDGKNVNSQYYNQTYKGGEQ